MRPSKSTHGERIVKDIKRKTRKQYSAEEKIRIVLDGLRGKESVAELNMQGLSERQKKILISHFTELIPSKSNCFICVKPRNK